MTTPKDENSNNQKALKLSSNNMTNMSLTILANHGRDYLTKLVG